MMNFVIFGLQPWDIDIGSNCKNIAMELAKNHRVLYVNAPLSRGQKLRNPNDPKVQKRIGFLKYGPDSIEEVRENLWVYYPDCIVESSNSIRPHALFRIINKINNRRFSKSIQKAVDELGFDSYVLFNDNSMFLGYYLRDLLNPTTSVYYIRDNLTKDAFWSYHGSRLESSLIASADLVVTNSVYYEEYARTYNARSFMIGQGCDFTLLDEPVDVQDMATISGPIVGYVGYLTARRLSIELISEIARKRPDWSVVLVGPEDDVFEKSILHEQKNIIFLGPKPVEELGSYIKAFDVCINPQVVNDMTIGNYPRKIDEYLYMGRPAVATYTKAMEIFSDYVSLVHTADEYVDAIANELAGDSAEKQASRRNFAESHSWANSVDTMLDKLQDG